MSMHQGEAALPRLLIAALMRPRAIIAEEVGGDEQAGGILARFGAPAASEPTVRRILWEVLLWSSEGRQVLVPFLYDAGRFPTVRAVMDHLAAESLIALSNREDGAGVWALNAADRLCWEDAVLEFERLQDQCEKLRLFLGEGAFEAALELAAQEG